MTFIVEGNRSVKRYKYNLYYADFMNLRLYLYLFKWVLTSARFGLVENLHLNTFKFAGACFLTIKIN